MRRLLITVCAALSSTTCFAHQDTVLKLNSDGRLDGLPAEYSPASLRVVFSQSSEIGEASISRLELKIGGKTVVVPGCVTGLALTRSMKDVRVVASWYHDTKSSHLPPYLSVTLADPGYEDPRDRPGYLLRPGYTLRFNLSTAKLFEMELFIDRGGYFQGVPVDFRERCFASNLEKFSEYRLRPNTSLERSRER